MQVFVSLDDEAKNFLHTAAPYIPMILQAIYEDSNDDVVHIPLRIDLVYLSRNYPQLSSLLFNQLSKFLVLFNRVVFLVASQEISRSSNQYLRDRILYLSEPDFNCYLDLTNCLIPNRDISNVGFLNQAMNRTQGCVVYLSQCLIVEQFPSEVYLYRWTQLLSGCLCQDKTKKIRKGQTFIQVLNSGHMKERSKVTHEICLLCDSVFTHCRMVQQVYLNCQKVRVSCPSTKRQDRQQLFHEFVDVYINFDMVNRYKVGHCLDMCCYYNLQQKVKILGPKTKIKVEESNIVLCISSYPSQAQPQHVFFNKTSRISIEYQNCLPNDYLRLYRNYQEITNGINQIKFPLCDPSTFTLLKLSLLSSIFYQSQYARQYRSTDETLNVLILTDEQQLVSSIIRIPDIDCKQFPTTYDHQSALLFLAGCHNGVVVFTNPSKKQYPYIQQVINRDLQVCGEKIPLKVTVWVIVSPLVYPGEFPFELFDLVVDITFLSNPNSRQVQHSIQGVVWSLMQRYLPEDQLGFTMTKGRRLKDLDSTVAKENKPTTFKPADDCDSMQFLEQYYLAARQHKKTNITSLVSLRKIAIGVAAMRRSFIREKTRPRVDFIDAVISIFLDQQTSRNKKGNNNTLLTNQIAKFLLNEKEQMVVHEFVFRQEDFEEVRRTVHKSSVFIKIVDELRRIVSGKNIV